jgi:hypothetical protein
MLTLKKIDKSRFRVLEERTQYRNGKLYYFIVIDEVFFEELVYNIWSKLELKEDQLDIALDEMAEYGHEIANFSSVGNFLNTEERNDVV